VNRFRSRLAVPIGLLSLVAIAAGAAAALQRSGANDQAIPRQSPARQTYQKYWVGDSFEGFRHTDTVRRLDKPTRVESFVAEYVSFFYGDCRADAAGGCPLPLEIQNWPACRRNLSLYRDSPGGPPLPRKRFVALGAPAAIFEDGGRVEVYTGKTTVVIFGTDAARLRRAAQALRPSGSNKPVDRLPPPASGALQGKLRCS
jgi:hypothetical protein